MATVFNFIAPKKVRESCLADRSKAWSNQDLAHLYRVESALIQIGLRVETERGATEEGDPWFIFCHVETGDVIVHFARIDGFYIVASPTLEPPIRGRDFEEIVRMFISDNSALTLQESVKHGSNIFLHPSAMLTAFVAAMFYINAPSDSWAKDGASWAKDETTPDSPDRGATQVSSPILIDLILNAPLLKDALEKTAILAAVAIAVEIAQSYYNGASTDIIGGQAVVVAGAGAGSRTIVASMLDDISSNAGLPSAQSHDQSTSTSTSAAANNPATAADDNAASSDLSIMKDGGKPAPVEELASVELNSQVPTQTKHGGPTGDHSLPARDTDLGGQILSIQRPAVANGGLDLQSKSQPADWVAAVTKEMASVAHESDPALVNLVMAHLLSPQVGHQDEPQNLTPSSSSASGSSTSPSSSVVSSTPSTSPSVKVSTQPNGIHVFDDFAAKVVAAFVKSSDDVEYIVSGTSIVFFDESDVLHKTADVQVQTWCFSDSTTVSIVGAAHTIDAVMHMSFA